jgi:hypothetical protein
LRVDESAITTLCTSSLQCFNSDSEEAGRQRRLSLRRSRRLCPSSSSGCQLSRLSPPHHNRNRQRNGHKDTYWPRAAFPLQFPVAGTEAEVLIQTPRGLSSTSSPTSALSRPIPKLPTFSPVQDMAWLLEKTHTPQPPLPSSRTPLTNRLPYVTTRHSPCTLPIVPKRNKSAHLPALAARNGDPL